MTLVRKNEFSRNREFKFVNKMAEGWLGRRISNRVMEEQRKYVYKQDTQEVEMVKKVLNKLIKANNL